MNAGKKKRQVIKNAKRNEIELLVSDDGRSIIDEHGTEIAKLRDGYDIRTQKKVKVHIVFVTEKAFKGPGGLPGYCHLVPVTECVIYNSDGTCAQYVTHLDVQCDPIKLDG